MKSFSRGQRLVIALNVAAMTVIAAALFFGVCYLAHLPAFRVRLDLTREQSFTLSPRTLDLLENLDDEVTVISVFHLPYRMDPTGQSIVEKEIGDYAAQLLEEYMIRSQGKIRLEILDRDRDNLRVGELNDELGFGSDNVIVFLCGNNRRDLFPADLARIDAGGLDPTTNVVQRAKVRAFNAEAAITQALLSVTEETKPKAYFTTGRKEAQIQDRSGEGLSMGAEALKRVNFEVEELKLYADPVIPEDCTVLVIPGPSDDFSEEEVAAVRSYLYSGGRLFLALSPQSTTTLEPILSEFDIGLDRAVTCQETRVSQQDLYRKAWIATDGFSEDSRITRALAEARLFSRFFKSGAVNRAPDDVNVTTLVWSPKDSWGDTHAPGEEGNYFFDSDREVLGARVLAVSCEGRDATAGAKLVFFADTYFYRNGAREQQSANLLLFTNALNWLSERDYLLDIPPKTPFESRVDLYEEEYNRIGFYTVVLIPALAALLGMLVWWFRRR